MQNLNINQVGFNETELVQLQNKSLPFRKLMSQYKCAMYEVKTKLDVLNEELSLDSEKNPIESISCRIKSPESIYNKLKNKNCALTVDSIQQNLHDVAGIRVICSFTDDIYLIAQKLCSQDDIKIIDVKDYIKEPKLNGYRSLHIIVEVPIFLSNEKKSMPVEVQFRTIAMNFWASLEHKLKYKKSLGGDVESISEELRLCAEETSLMDMRMQNIRNRIEKITCADKPQ